MVIEKPNQEYIFVPKRELGTFRKGMWVHWAGYTCIIFAFEGTDKVRLHIINGVGDTVEDKTVLITEIRQSRIREIPECRRGIAHELDYPD